MVKNYLRLFVALVFVTNLMAQNVPNYVPTNGLVGWWPFNGDANDESGNGNHGTVNGATLTIDRNGKSNSAYSFDGVSNFISISNILSLNYSNQFSISCWVKVIGNNASNSAAQYFISRGNDLSSGAFLVSIFQGSKNQFYMGINGNGNAIAPTATESIPQVSWHHIVTVYSGTSLKLFIDGVLVITNPYSQVLGSNASNIFFGRHANSSFPYFTNGKLDDISIYNRALTLEEITALYTSTPPCTNPSALITPQGNTTFCQGGFVNLNASTGANYTYEWYKNGQLINGATASVYQAITSGNYIVKVIDGACNATSTATTVTVNQYPSSGVNISGNTTFCEGNSVTLTAQGSGTYLWSNGATSKSITVNQAGSYGVAVTSNGCVSNSNQTTVTVNPNPTATITPQGNTTFCQGGFVNLNASTGANYTYEWYKNGQLINGATASVYQATTSGNYTVKVIDGACNATSTTTTVTVNQYPSSVVNVSGNTTFCEGNSVTLTAQGNGTYLWSNGATSKSITVNQAGSYGVAVTSNGCVSNSNQTTVTVNPNPIATLTPQGNTTFCQGGFVNLVASGGSIYQWNTGSSAPIFSVTQSGTYTVNVFNSFGCQASASQQVTVNPLPNVTLNAINQFTLKNASPIQLVANPTGGTFSGEGVQGSTFNPANVSLGKKTITYNYTSPQGCSGKASSNTFVVDSIGNVCNVTKYDTVKVTKTVYDTLKVTKTIYDTVKVTKTINDTVSILKVKFKLTTGIKANQYTTMNVYPNPTSDVIIIEASDVAALNGYSYKLFDVQGKELYNTLVTNVKTEISLKTFGKAGVYILHVVDANNASIQTKQIILE